MKSDDPLAAVPGSKARTMPGGRAKAAELPKGGNGRTLCRWCSLEVPSGRRTFCSEWCVHEWRLRTDPGYLRDRVLARDRGICALCRVNTLSAWIRMKKARGNRRILALQEWGLTRLIRSSLWDADHIVPVVEGGGECDLSNIRTLCLNCHRHATAELRKRRPAKDA
jgi:5-methylcytosine-specific restriction protein A